MSGLITIDSRSLRRGGAPWFPVSGEYHFSRGRPENWERELRRMKAGGLGLVASYLIWNIHEPVRGARRWDGECDFRRFVQIAGDVGLDVVARIGPWAHAEARFGGFPDWLQELPIGLRTDDPAYLEIVDDWYADVARQLDGLVRDANQGDTYRRFSLEVERARCLLRQDVGKGTHVAVDVELAQRHRIKRQHHRMRFAADGDDRRAQHVVATEDLVTACP